MPLVLAGREMSTGNDITHGGECDVRVDISSRSNFFCSESSDNVTPASVHVK